MAYDYLIIGEGAAGVNAAEAIRGIDEKGSICILSEEPHGFYSRVLMPSYLKRKIPREKVFLRKDEDYAKKNITVRRSVRVEEIDGQKKNITTSTGDHYEFGKLLIASGGHVNEYPFAGEKIFRFQTLDDADRIFSSLGSIKHPAVIGSSFIGFEFLEIYSINNSAPTLLLKGSFGFEQCVEGIGWGILEKNFRSHGVTILKNSIVSDIQENEEGLTLTYASGANDSFDTLGVGIGVARNIDFVRTSGVAVGEKGILTNEYLETNIPDIYSAGDVAEYLDPITQKTQMQGNWTSAFLQGRRAGMNMAGTKEVFRAVSTYSITNFGFHISALGDLSSPEKTIVRIGNEEKWYERLFFRSNLLVGATLINRFPNAMHYARLIETGRPMEEYMETLSDPLFDIKSIPL